MVELVEDALPPGFDQGDLETVSCDICGSNSFQVLYKKEGFPIVECRDCGLVQVNPRLSPRALMEKVYTESYFTADTGVGGSDHFGSEAPGRRAKAKRDLAWMAAHGITGGRLVEVGSAGGFFVDEARKAGFEASGIEPEAGAARHGQEVLGLPITHGSWEKIKEIKEPVDLFYFSHVLEHLPSPSEALATMMSLLKPGGHLVFEVPHWGSLPCQKQGVHWVIIAPLHHLYYFRTKDLQTMVEKVGFKWVDHHYPELGLVDLYASSGAMAAAGVSGVQEKKSAIKKVLGPLKKTLQDGLGWADRTFAAPILGKDNGVAVQVLVKKI